MIHSTLQSQKTHPHPRWLTAALVACLVVGVLRAALLVFHSPLIALANSYDEVRYTACFDLYPDRPADIPPTRNSPEAPFAYYRFLHNDQTMCYWSSELLFQGLVAGIYGVEHVLTGAERHSVRWIGALKFLALTAVWLTFTLAWLRRGAHAAALANGLLLPLLFADPANTIYLNTFYAEWTALLAAYALVGLLLLDLGQRPNRARETLLVLAAFLLATSKIQHLLLPLCCAALVFVFRFWRNRHWSWQGMSVLLGATLGLAVQVVQLGRDSDAIQAIDMFNRADVAFTGLLPNSSDPAATAAELELDPGCLRYSGLRAWQLPNYPGAVCPSLAHVTRGRELAVLLREPGLTLRLGWHGLTALEPWLAPGLGLVEGGDFTRLPNEFFTLSDILTGVPVLRAIMLAGAPLALLLLLPGGPHRRPLLLLYTALTVAVMLATLTITVLGDGLADTPKQGHLVLNAALAWWIAALVFAARRLLTRR